jgi:hypothetical protein
MDSMSPLSSYSRTGMDRCLTVDDVVRIVAEGESSATSAWQNAIFCLGFRGGDQQAL